MIYTKQGFYCERECEYGDGIRDGIGQKIGKSKRSSPSLQNSQVPPTLSAAYGN